MTREELIEKLKEFKPKKQIARCDECHDHYYDGDIKKKGEYILGQYICYNCYSKYKKRNIGKNEKLLLSELL